MRLGRAHPVFELCDDVTDRSRGKDTLVDHLVKVHDVRVVGEGCEETRHQKVLSTLHQSLDDVDREDQEIWVQRVLVERSNESSDEEPVEEIVLRVVHVLDDR